MHVLVIGGTGFLGYHAAHELLRRQHRVSILGLPPSPPPGQFPEDVDIVLADINQSSDQELTALFKPYDAIVFAAGVDDRAVPPAPAYNFFYEANVKSAVRATTAAMKAGVERFVLLGSYFSHFNREWPELELAENHPYIRSRKEQLELCTSVAGQEMAMVVLELPYIFGSMPNAVPLWAPLVSYVRSGVPLYYTNGGTNMVAVQHVAEAIAGACERIDESRVFQIGDENVPWTDFLQALCRIVGREDDEVHLLKDDNVINMSWVGDAMNSLLGKEAGLHTSHFSRIQTAFTYFDPSESRQVLGYGSGGLEQAWQDTVSACPLSGGMRSWRTFVATAKHLLRH